MERINDIFLFGENLTLDKLIINNIAMQSFFNNIDDIAIEIEGIGQTVISSRDPRQIYFPYILQAEYTSMIIFEEGYNIMQYYEEDEKELLLSYVPKHAQFVCISYRQHALVLLKRIMNNLLADVPLFVDDDMGTLLPINTFLQNFDELM